MINQKINLNTIWNFGRCEA